LSPSQAGSIVTFLSVHAALAAERDLKGRGIQPELIPVPREISSACGFCLFLRAAPDVETMECIDRFRDREAVFSIFLEEGTTVGRREKRYERIDEGDRREGLGLPGTGHQDEKGP
jgi:hypothetical protein